MELQSDDLAHSILCTLLRAKIHESISKAILLIVVASHGEGLNLLGVNFLLLEDIAVHQFASA